MTTWAGRAALALLALAGAGAAEGAGRGATGPTEAVDAEMLRDLDLLDSPDHARDREVARRMRFLERLRMLEIQGAEETAARPAPAPPSEPAKAPR